MEAVRVSNLSKIETIRSCSSREGIGISTLPKPFALIDEILPEEMCFFI